MTTVQNFAEATNVRSEFSFDAIRLAEYMRAHTDGFCGPLTVRQFAGGQSNPTYLLTTPDRDYVLRRKPPGQLLASAHAIDREYKVITSLSARTRVPVPRTYALCRDESVIGTWFYIMEHVKGRIFANVALPEIPCSERSAYFDAMNSTIAALHSTDYASIGLADFGRPDNYVRRQLRRWSALYVEDTLAGRVPVMGCT
jgi:aminoglycoside phosphotransferase (APT) family kinase protein